MPFMNNKIMNLEKIEREPPVNLSDARPTKKVQRTKHKMEGLEP